MKKILTTLYAFCMALSFAYAGDKDAPKAAQTFEDSVLKHYLNNGAWKCSLFSRQRERHIDSALAVLPQNAYLWQQRGMPCLKQGKYELAIRFIDSAAKYDPKRYVEYRAFSKCIFAKTYREAITDFDLARKLNGNAGVMDHPYDFYTALCYLQLNQFDSAEIFLRKSIDYVTRTNGENWVHYMDWYYLGIIRHEREDYTGALQYLNKSLAIYPNFSDAEFYKATCLMKTGNKDTALAVVRQAKADAEKGYTMNEDNVYYETYPYQLKKYFRDGIVSWIEDDNKK